MRWGLCIFVCGVVGSKLFALPVGNPSDIDMLTRGIGGRGAAEWNLRLGYDGNFVFNRNLKVLPSGSYVERVSVMTNAGYLALSLFDRGELFGTLGSSSLNLCSQAGTFGSASPSDSLEIGSDVALSWSVGGRATLLRCACWTLHVEGQYFKFDPEITRFVGGGVYENPGNGVSYREWQVGCGLSYYLELLLPVVPYVAVGWSQVEVGMGGEFLGVTLRDLEERRKVGYAVGVSLIDDGAVALTVEGRFVSERALYANLQVRL